MKKAITNEQLANISTMSNPADIPSRYMRMIASELLWRRTSNENTEKPVWTMCVFEGDPPIGFVSWLDWMEKSCERQYFSGVHIRAATGEDYRKGKGNDH